MSIEYDKNNVINDDDKFIDALYAQVEAEVEDTLKNTQGDDLTTNPNSRLFSEQPSESLDQSILAAAHKSVESSPKAINITSEKLTKINKSRAWHVPFGLAASTVLVVTLLVNQGEESVLPNSDVMFAPSSVQIENTLSNESAGMTKKQMTPQGKSRELAKQGSRQALKSTHRSVEDLAKLSAPILVQAVNKQDDKATVEMSPLHATKAAQYDASSDIEVQSLAGEQMASLEEKSTVSKFEGSNSISLLSLQQYQLYKQQKKQWRFRQESEQYYVIDVFGNESEATQYKLSKKYFYINRLTIISVKGFVGDLANDTTDKYSFEQIVVFDEK
jgi:hypothetical protein